AWESLFPKKGGYFTHPTLAPHESVFSVFHQLHCVEHIWRHWWAFYDVAGHQANRRSHLHHTHTKSHSDSGQILDPNHMSHCIELLRNVIMCRPDLTIEVKRDDLGGVTGFGTDHVCQDWNGLVEWTREWE
ncbi:hypothetical protein LX36DRAFT_586765, partial [Colletotrichum falcatum]